MKPLLAFCLFCTLFLFVPAVFAVSQSQAEPDIVINDKVECPPTGLPAGTPQPPARTSIPSISPTPDLAGTVITIPIKIVPKMPDPRSRKTYRIQVGAFSNIDLAWRCYDRLKSAGLDPAFELHGTMYRVVIAGQQAANISDLTRRLEAMGFTEAWIREEN